MKFTKDGEYIKEWGRIGNAPGECRTPHALAFDSQGRLFVADRGNHRIQIFDQDGNFIDAYEQFGRVSGLFIDDHDTLYAIDSESNPTRHPDWSRGIRIGSATEDKVTASSPRTRRVSLTAPQLKVWRWTMKAMSMSRRGHSPVRPPKAD